MTVPNATGAPTLLEVVTRDLEDLLLRVDGRLYRLQQYAPHPAPQPQGLVALAAWRRELAAGARHKVTFDPLWRAACAEAWAAECGSEQPLAAVELRSMAIEILKAAARGSPR